MPHYIPTLSTPCHCERIDMSHRLIHARPETTHGSGRVDILHVSKEKRARRQTRRSGAIWGKMLRMRRTQFSDRVHICAKWRRRRLSTTETRRDLVKLFSAGESLSPVPGFDRGSCVPPDPRSNYAAGLILRMGPAAPCYLTVEAPPQQPLPSSLSLRDVVLAYGGYRTLRVAGGVTFRRIGAGKSVF